MKINRVEGERRIEPPTRAVVRLFACNTPDGGQIFTVSFDPGKIRNVVMQFTSAHNIWHERQGTPTCSVTFTVTPDQS